MVSHIVDVSAVTYFAPLLAFLIVFVIMFLLLKKTKPFGDSHPWADAFMAFLVAIVFVSFGGIRQIVLDVTPWFALLIIVLFFIFIIAGFVGKTEDIAGKRLGWAFVIILILIFLISGVKVFSHTLAPYLPGPYFGVTGDPQALYFFEWLYSPPIIGAILLLIVAAAVSWVLVKFSKK